MIRARDLKRGQNFVFRGEQYVVIVCISSDGYCVQNVVAHRSDGSTLIIQLHKNFYVEARGEPKPVEVLSMTTEELLSF